jgi:hypothetical protein
MNPLKIEQSIKLASHWLFSVSGLPTSLTLYWVKLLPILFGEKLSKERILLLALRKHKVQDDHNESVKTMAFALLSLVSEKAQENHQLNANRKLSQQLNQLNESFSIDQQQVNTLVKYYKKALINDGDRMIISIPGSIFPLVIDHLVRWILVWTLFPDFPDIFWTINYALLPITLLALSWWNSRKVKRYNQLVLENYGELNQFKLKTSHNAVQYSILTFLVLISILSAYILAGDQDRIIIVFTTLLGYLIYYGIYLGNFSQKRLREKSLIDQMDDVHRYGEALDADANDAAIIEVETKVKAAKGRMDAYVLESALFGALSFSGFLQIMAEDLVSFQNLEDFAFHSFQLVQHFVLWKPDAMAENLSALTTKQDLFSLISVETLVCSILFLAVIASRLRVSDMIDQITHDLTLARAFNVKEENLLFQKGKEDEKLEMYNEKIRDHLITSEKGVLEMNPAAEYMRFFRNAGILTFFIILLSSSLFISSFLGWIFFLAGISSLVYFNRKALGHLSEKLLVSARWLVLRRGTAFLAASTFAFILGFLLRTLVGWHHTDWLIFSSVILLGIYLFIWIAFIPQYDERFQGKFKLENTGWWGNVRLIWGAVTFILVLGITLKLLDLPGAGILIGISTTLFSIILIALGRQMTVAPGAGILLGIAMSMLSFGIGFKIMHFPGSAVLVTIGSALTILTNAFIQLRYTRPRLMGWLYTITILAFLAGYVMKMIHLPGAGPAGIVGWTFLVFTIIFNIWYKPVIRAIHLMLMKSFLFIMMIAILVIGSNKYGELAYDHYTLEPEFLNRISRFVHDDFPMHYEIINQQNEPKTFRAEIEHHLREGQWYQNTVPYYTDIHHFIYTWDHEMAHHIYFNYKDSVNLNLGYQFAKNANQSIKLNDFPIKSPYEKGPFYLPLLEPLLLMNLGKKEEAYSTAEKLKNQLKSMGADEYELQKDLEKVYANRKQNDL